MLYVIDEHDNVATALADLKPGQTRMAGARTGVIELLQAVPFGHKAALSDIAAGDDVVKYSTTIARATRDIKKGNWVHTHNCESLCDPRTGNFDEETDEVDDMRYVPRKIYEK